MRRCTVVLVACALVLSLVGCQTFMWGTDELIERVREEFPIADADTIDIEYAGNSQTEGRFLHWFISGNSYQEHTYLAMDCTLIEGKGFRFERALTPMERGDDIAVAEWNGGYAFCVNNRNCKTIRIKDAAEEKEVDIPWKENSRPFVYFNERIPIEYSFLDENGTPIM